MALRSCLRRWRLGPSRRFFFGLVALFLLCEATWGEATAPRLVVVLPEAICPRGSSVFLGEYASLEGEQELVDRASLARLSLSGGKLTRGQVVAALQDQGLAGIPVRLQMPTSVTLGQEDPLEGRIRRAAHWPWRVAARPDRPVDPATPLPPGLRSGMRSVSLNVATSEEPARFVRVVLRWYQPQVVAKSHLRKGETIRREDVFLRLGIQDTYRLLAHSFQQVEGKVLRIPVKAGVPVAMEVLVRDEVVHAGNQVVLSSVVGSVAVEAKGRALEQGAVGDTIRVRNLDTRQIVSGVVVGPGRVEILQKEDGGV